MTTHTLSRRALVGSAALASLGLPTPAKAAPAAVDPLAVALDELAALEAACPCEGPAQDVWLERFSDMEAIAADTAPTTIRGALAGIAHVADELDDMMLSEAHIAILRNCHRFLAGGRVL